MHPNGTDPTYAPGEVARALDAARELIAAGVPVFVAEPNPSTKLGFNIPLRWQFTPLDPDAPGRWEPGSALCAVGGYVLDIADDDPRNGGDIEALFAAGVMPRVYASAETPSGGTHHFVATLGVPKVPNIRPGVDLQAGIDGDSHGFVFIAPTVRASKVDGVRRPYRWKVAPDAEHIRTEAPTDDSGAALAEMARQRTAGRPQLQATGQLDEDDGLGNPSRTRRVATDLCFELIRAFAAMTDSDAYFNTELNRVAVIVGHHVPEFWERPEVEGWLFEAAKRNGSVRHQGAAGVWATIRSGLDTGVRQPYALRPESGSSDDSEGALEAGDQPGRGRDGVGTWSRQDLDAYLDGTHVPETATRFAREDGVRLLYPGRVHSFHGESESGKSLVAQYVCAEALLAGDEALYIDFESDAANLVERMLAFGVPADVLRKSFTYVRPDAGPGGESEREAYAELFAHHYAVAVVDGVTESMGMFGVESSGDNDQVAKWMRRFPRKLAGSTGAAVVLIDHVTKSPESRGRFALGAQAKLAGLDGAAYTVEVREGLGRGARGAVSMRIAKDRPGDIRPKCGQFRAVDRTQEAAYLVIDSTGTDQRIRVSVRPPRADADAAGPVMEQVSRYLEEVDEPPSQTVLCAAVTGRAMEIRHAANRLIALGYVRLMDGPRNVRMHVSVKPYRTRSSVDEDEDEGYSDGLG